MKPLGGITCCACNDISKKIWKVMSLVAWQRKRGIKANLAGCLKIVAMVTGMCRSVPKRIDFINFNIK